MNFTSAKDHFKVEWILALVLIIFILFKIDAITLPYFWDELGVYSRAALHLHDHGLSLLPKDLPPELSRGHPMLFSFIYGLSFTLFGDTILTGHITTLFISIVFIIALYLIFKDQFQNKYFALAAASIVLIQPIFVAQSVMVLPEVMLALFMILSLYFFSKQKYILYMLFSSAAILVKETAIIIPIVVFTANAIILFARENSLKEIFKLKYFSAFIPLAVFGGFLFIQKQQNGWYFFPYHIEAVS
ncbi:MAG: glycosyltransferase family 39 protein, partial [Fimbriimonadaceae bacterium]|nr:glycosyltransferase family 39 protein [Chitinophagales bacterium]